MEMKKDTVVCSTAETVTPAMAGSKLEIHMLEYSLREANEKLEKTEAKLSAAENQLEHTTELADQRAEKLSRTIDMMAELKLYAAQWKVVAVLEGVVILSYLLTQGVM